MSDFSNLEVLKATVVKDTQDARCHEAYQCICMIFSSRGAEREPIIIGVTGHWFVTRINFRALLP